MLVPEHLPLHARHSSRGPGCWGQPGDVVRFMMNLQTPHSVRGKCDADLSFTRSNLWLCENVHRQWGYLGHGLATARFCCRDEHVALRRHRPGLNLRCRSLQETLVSHCQDNPVQDGSLPKAHNRFQKLHHDHHGNVDCGISCTKPLFQQFIGFVEHDKCSSARICIPFIR